MRVEEQEPEPEPEPEYEDDDDDETEESNEIELERKQSKANKVSRVKYKCETNHKVFRSYQACGGHRASHKKARAHNNGVSNQTP
ncbi:Zinc finger protein ZAT9 [Camellia lanceoleosa]|uniref:Zinc finger protein ZAT9 n=1 Tax=Camellia lanceoleosa TaxID=1840588 RepID=A0ACC0G1H9_9ERIC|nr:Zinc finger protein ZAT9 [Camellia lanceoleosa]